MSEEMSYNLDCEFDPAKHAKTFVNYLEVLIEKDGHVVYAVPSHQEKAIQMACKARNWTRKQLEEACPREYYLDFLSWILAQSGSISVWDRMYIGEPNEAQKAKLKELKGFGLYKGTIGGKR